ncbi:MAG: phenylalanine--tRNA ligase subunit alpha [Candidatus Altiarchaeota archaeon]|nr:phenylalanine--tRNA ligase subunit alpha [Candidatus Altiarchaeota archaeon]
MHPLEAKILRFLKRKKRFSTQELAQALGIKPEAATRMSYSLSRKGLVSMDKQVTTKLVRTKEGKEVMKKGLPEKRLMKILPEKLDNLPAELKATGLQWAIKHKWVKLSKGKVEPIKQLNKLGWTKEELALKSLEGDEEAIKLLKRRKWVEQVKKTEFFVEATKRGKEIKIKDGITALTPKLIASGKWKQAEFTPFAPTDPGIEQLPGRIHPLTEMIEKVRKIFLGMGFTESAGSMIESSFWNFDALFVPQDHPAREMQDTFYLSGKSRLPKQISEKVKAIHKQNWGSWDPNQAMKRVLRTHVTALSAKEIYENEPPAKIFSIGKIFRNETLDYKHLAELYQIDGLVFDEKVTFDDLFGYLKQFFLELGFDKIRIRPAYFPYTEPSVEIDVYFPEKKDWLELGGAGMFRPEVVEPLTGKDCPVLAWGLGLERITMLYYGINDIRKLYKSELEFLRTRRIMK